MITTDSPATVTSPSPEQIAEQTVFDEHGVRLALGVDTIIGSVDLPEFRKATANDDLIGDDGDDILHTCQIITHDPEFWGMLGFEAEGQTITAPSNDRLNKLRQGLIESTGIHGGTFVDYPGGFIENMHFVEYLSRREIPMAVGDLELAAHDNLTHRLNYAVMSEVVFSRFVAWATKAVRDKDEAMAEDIISALDEISSRGRTLGLGGIDGAQYLAMHYREFMSPFVAGARASKDARAQRRTVRKLESLARSSTNEPKPN